MHDRHLRLCLTCKRPLYSLSGQRKRHPECARRHAWTKQNAARKVARDLSAAEIEQRFEAAKLAIRRRVA